MSICNGIIGVGGALSMLFLSYAIIIGLVMPMVLGANASLPMVSTTTVGGIICLQLVWPSVCSWFGPGVGGYCTQGGMFFMVPASVCSCYLGV